MLKHTLRANAVSCALFGAIFILAGPVTAELIGDPPLLILQLLGAVLLINAAMLGWTSTRRAPKRLSVLFFSLGDALWVAATAGLLVTGYWITTTSGIVWSIVVAAFVGTCGILQWRFAPGQN